MAGTILTMDGDGVITAADAAVILPVITIQALTTTTVMTTTPITMVPETTVARTQMEPEQHTAGTVKHSEKNMKMLLPWHHG